MHTLLSSSHSLTHHVHSASVQECGSFSGFIFGVVGRHMAIPLVAAGLKQLFEPAFHDAHVFSLSMSVRAFVGFCVSVTLVDSDFLYVL